MKKLIHSIAIALVVCAAALELAACKGKAKLNPDGGSIAPAGKSIWPTINP